MLASTQKLYQKIAKGKVEGFTVPAFNIRTLTVPVARALFRAAKKEEVGAFIVELARSEMEYTSQSPREYKNSIMEAVKEEKFEGPVFLQGDHFKAKAEDYIKNKEKEQKLLERLIKEAVKAGFYNIDIDCSQFPIQENARLTAKFTSFIRATERSVGVRLQQTVSVGGEVGVIGGENTTVEELQEFIDAYNQELGIVSDLSLTPIIKAAVQTGTSHGKGGEVDFGLLRELSEKAREYGLAGVVQHGASTLPKEQFRKFPEAKTLEIHLATELQDIILKNPYFPEDLKEKVTKKTLGKFKKEILGIPQRNISKICEELEAEFTFFFRALNVSGTSDLIKSIY